MKVIIAGGRDYIPEPKDAVYLDGMRDTIPILEVVCGMAFGADAFGYAWAITNGMKPKEFPPDWDRFGKAAGGIRNEAMAKYADCLISFPGNSGTRSMLGHARAYGLSIYQPYGESDGTQEASPRRSLWDT